MATPAPAPTPAAHILRSGESAQQAKLAELKSDNVRTFHHMVPGACFIMPNGLEVQFLGGSFTTAEPDIIAELSAIADKPSSMVYTKAEIAASVATLTAKVAADAVQ